MYDPANPVRAVIVEDYYILANMLLVIGGVFALAGCFGCLLFESSRLVIRETDFGQRK